MNLDIIVLSTAEGTVISAGSKLQIKATLKYNLILKLLKNKSIINLGKECHGGNGMNINTLLGITTSTLRAYFTKQNVTANNVANMNTEDFKFF